MESLIHLYEAQRLALDNVIALIKAEQIDHIKAQGSEVINACLEAFVRYEAMLSGQAHNRIPSRPHG